MRSIIINVAVALLRWYIGTGVFDRIKERVVDLIGLEATGKVKRDTVVAFAKNELVLVSEQSVRAAIELILLAAPAK